MNQVYNNLVSRHKKDFENIPQGGVKNNFPKNCEKRDTWSLLILMGFMLATDARSASLSIIAYTDHLRSRGQTIADFCGQRLL